MTGTDVETGQPEPLPPFSGDDPTCIKCGNEGAYAEWKRAVDDIPSPTNSGVTIRFARPEYLERQCSRCGFTWKEAVISDHSKETR